MPRHSQQKYCLHDVHVILLQPSTFYRKKESRMRRRGSEELRSGGATLRQFCYHQGEPHLDICSTAWATFAVVLQPVTAEGLLHCFLDDPFSKALLHKLLNVSCGRQVLVSDVSQFICITEGDKTVKIYSFPLRNKHHIWCTFSHALISDITCIDFAVG